MASTRQLRHHARFHAAVLRHFFPTSPLKSHQEAPNVNEKVNFQIQSPKSTELIIQETYSNNEGVEPGKALLSRAQRKRLKLKNLKEGKSNAVRAKKFIGPLLQDVLEERRLESDDWKSVDVLLQENATIERNHVSSSTSDEIFLKEMGRPKVLSTTAGEELAKTEEATSLCLETGEVKDIRDGVELEFLSKAKRRRLAKKKFQDSSRRPTAGSLFTAEIKGEDIIVKQIL